MKIKVKMKLMKMIHRLACKSRDNARVLRPVLREARGETPRGLLGKRSIWIFLLAGCFIHSRLQAQIASFSFSQYSTAGYGWSDAGWTNVYGDPHTAVRSATAGGVTVSSIGTTNWVTSTGSCVEDGVGASPGTFFPTHILACHWYQYSSSGLAVYNQLVPQFKLSGLNKDSFYILRMASSYNNGTFGDPTQYTVSGLTVAPSQYGNSYLNTSTGVTFQHIYPDASGAINVYVNTTTGKNVCYISGIQIFPGSSTVGIPIVNITNPADNDVMAEETNITLRATATENGGTISKVEFFADTTKLGESTTSPYSVTWLSPNEGHYTITAKATDAAGTASTSLIHISVESLSSFWSMTGNIAMNADSNFVGNVDSVRLAFRTNNIERMSVLGDGTVGIGTKDTKGYKLAVNGTGIFTKVKVKTFGTWPDYVFKKGYSLPGLPELEQYLAEHHHLPGIASEETVQKSDGVDVGEQQIALLRKIEELTLYLIDQNKKLEKQQKEIEELKKLIQAKK